MNRDFGTRSAWLATSTVRTCTRSAARNRISLICTGQASASTQTTMAQYAAGGGSLLGAKCAKLHLCRTRRATMPKMVKTPNYRQDKRRREDAQKKRNEEEQARQQARKKGVATDPPPNDVRGGLGRAARVEDAAERHRRDAPVARESRHRPGLVPVRGGSVRPRANPLPRQRAAIGGWPCAGVGGGARASARGGSAALRNQPIDPSARARGFRGLQPVPRRGGCRNRGARSSAASCRSRAFIRTTNLPELRRTTCRTTATVRLIRCCTCCAKPA